METVQRIKCVEYIPPNRGIGEIEFPVAQLREPLSYPQEVHDKVKLMVNEGYSFAAELITGAVALYVEHNEDEVDVAIKIVHNPKDLNQAFMDMIVKFDFDKAKAHREEMNNE